MESDRDYVIGTVLRIVFKKDKGFADWLKDAETDSGQPASVAVSTVNRLRA